MQKRLNKNVVPFAQDATSGKRYVFGETVASDDVNDNVNDNIIKGWESGLDSNGKPPMSWFNAVMYASTQLTAYLYQNGVPEFDENQKYYINSFSSYGGVIYRSTTGDETSPNIGNTPGETSSWEKIDAGTVGGVSKDLLGIGGDGYAWVDETANRSKDVIYTNTYGKPINVSLIIDSETEYSIAYIIVDGIRISGSRSPFQDGTHDKDTISVIVPSGSTYECSEDEGTIGILSWTELK